MQRADDTAEKIIVRYEEFKSNIDAGKSFLDTLATSPLTYDPFFSSINI